MKKLLLLTLALLLCLCFVGCSCSTDENTDESDWEDDSEDDGVHTHWFSEWAEVKAPSCNEYGKEERTCLCGETEERNIEMTEHTGKAPVKENEVAATCQAAGSYEAVVYCTVCNEKMDSEVIVTEKTPHSMSRIVETDENCNGVPVSNVYCGFCSAYVTSYGHKYEETSLLPTCTEQGYNRKTCVLCGDNETTYISAFGHLEKGWEADKEANCQRGGHFVNKCTLCSVVIDEKETEKLEHIYVATLEGEVLKYSCVSCSDSYTEEIEGDVFTVDFVTNGGNTCQSITVKSGDVVNLPEVTKDGYCLSGWYYDNGGNAEYFDEPIFEDTTLYAIWQEKEKVSIEDHAIETSVGLDFSFDVSTNGGQIAGKIDDYISVYDISDKKVKINITSKGNGIYTVSSEEYEESSYYYAVVKEPLCFTDTEQLEKQFTTKGENKTDVKLNDSVLKLNAIDVYGVIEENGKSVLLTNAELNVGDDVSIYEGNENNIVSVINIKSKSEMNGFNAYGFELSDYDAVFDSFDLSVSSPLEFDNFSLNPDAQDEIIEQFLASPLYLSAKSAAEKIATEKNHEFEFSEDIKFSFGCKDGKLALGVELTFDFENEFEIKVIFNNEISVTGQAYYKSSSDNALLAITKAETQVKIEGSYGIREIDVGEDKVKFDSYKNLVKKFKEHMESSSKEIPKDPYASKKHINLGSGMFPVGVVNFYIDVSFALDFSFVGTVALDLHLENTVTVGIKDGKPKCSTNADLEASSLYAQAQLEVNPMLKLEIGANALGLCLYAEGNVGPYLDMGAVGVWTYDGERFRSPTGSLYMEFGIKFGADVGVKAEIRTIGIRWTLFDLKYNLIEEKIPARTFGKKEIALCFAEYEKTINKEHDCKDDFVFDLSEIDTEITIQKYDDLELENREEKCNVTIEKISGYESKVQMNDNKIFVTGVPEKIIITVKVTYSELITKNIDIVVDVEHPEGCIHKKCTNHTGGTLTCTAKAICENCGLEYGEEPKGHQWNNYTCAVCGKYRSSEGLEYEREGDEYYVVGIGSCADDIVIIPETYDGLPVTGIEDGAFEDSYIEGVIITEQIMYIGQSAFDNCTSLKYNVYDNAYYLGNDDNKYVALVSGIDYDITSCEINERTKIISSGAFSYRDLLTSIDIPDSVTAINSHAFFCCKKLNSIHIGNGVVDVAADAFYEVPTNSCIEYNSGYYLGNELNPYMIYLKKKIGLRYTTLHPDTKIIHSYAFSDDSIMKTLELPKGLKRVGNKAFYNCSKLTNVYYLGDIAGWCEIEFGDGNANPAGGEIKLTIANELVQGVITIPSSVKKIGDYAFNLNQEITGVVIENGVEVIGDWAFNWCENITDISIPESILTIGEAAFRNCESMKTVVFDSDAKLEKIGSAAFQSCISLTSIMIPNSVKDIEEGAFGYCEGLTSVVLPDGIERIENGTFQGCESLTEIKIPDTVLYVGEGAFRDSGLINVEIPSGTTYIGERVFANCTSLTKVLLPEGTTVIGKEWFSGCTSFVSFDIPSNVVEIEEQAFYGCTSLEFVDFSSNVERIGKKAFYQCTALRNLNLPRSLYFIGNNAFSDCDRLESITIPGNVGEMGGSVFSSCDELKLAVFEAGELTEVCGFSDCKKLSNVVIPEGIVTIRSEAFAYCVNLRSIVLPSTITNIGNNAFYGCEGLAEIYNLSKLNLSCGSKSNGYVAYYALNIYDDLNAQSNQFTTDDGFVFYEENDDCYLMGYVGDETDLILPESCNGKHYKINSNAFSDNQNITSVKIPSKVTSIGSYAFYGCKNLRKVEIENGVKKICANAFRYCKFIKIVIPESVEVIEANAFVECIYLTIYCCAYSKPDGWERGWNYCRDKYGYYAEDCPVEWGYTE